jgi:hypothetical protein
MRAASGESQEIDHGDSMPRRRLWAWGEGEYHQTPHGGLDGTTPLDAWAMRSGDVRVPGPELDLRDMFLFEQKRKV